jgi:subfamily B ATP-binding cassette protein MsbA
VVEDLRESVFARLLGLNIGYVEGERKGDIMSRTTSDVVEVEHSVVTTFESLIRDPVSILYYLGLMLMFSVKLTLFIFIVLPVAAILISRITKSLKSDAVETQSTFGQIMSVVDETVGGIRIIKAFNGEGYIKGIFDRFNAFYSKLTRRQWHKKALIPIFSESAMVLVFGAVLWYGGNLVYRGEMDNASGFITYLGLFFLISRPAKSISSSFSNIYKGIASADRIFHLMDIEPKVKSRPGATRLTTFEQNIEIRNLSFAYKTEDVLHGINLKIEKGKVYALVGASGSGKSTLAELILRFYDPTGGQILIDGHDLRDVDLHSLRQMMAVVTQEPILFNDTIYNNIAFGQQQVTLEQVEAAARAANAHDFIMESPDGYQTLVGDRGGLLSGGQRQRISIARAILKNPPILILDEATSALDTASEKLVQDALYRLMAHRTSLVIAHRLSTIQDAGEIIVLEKGRIVEKGTHSDLLALGRKYRSLYRMQSFEGEQQTV